VLKYIIYLVHSTLCTPYILMCERTCSARSEIKMSARNIKMLTYSNSLKNFFHSMLTDEDFCNLYECGIFTSDFFVLPQEKGILKLVLLANHMSSE
jgi:hypothetical protein